MGTAISELNRGLDSTRLRSNLAEQRLEQEKAKRESDFKEEQLGIKYGKKINVKFYIKKPEGMAVQIDEDLLRSILESDLRRDGFTIQSGDNGPFFLEVEIDMLKVNDYSFCYTMSTKLTTYNFNPSLNDAVLLIYSGGTFGINGLKSDYDKTFKDTVTDESIKARNALMKSVKRWAN